MKLKLSNQQTSGLRHLGVCPGIFSLVFAFSLIFSASINAGTFFDDFNDGKAGGWLVSAGKWEVVDGEYRMPEEVNTAPYPLTYAFDGKEFGEFTIEAKIRNDKFHSTMNQSHDGFAFGMDDQNSGYVLYFRHHQGLAFPGGTLVLRWTIENVIGGFDPNADVAEAAAFDAGDEGKWHVLKAELSAKNKILKAWVDGKEALDIKLDKSINGKLGLWAADIGAASFDDVSITGSNIPSSDVQPGGKLATTWGGVKARY